MRGRLAHTELIFNPDTELVISERLQVVDFASAASYTYKKKEITELKLPPLFEIGSEPTLTYV